MKWKIPKVKKLKIEKKLKTEKKSGSEKKLRFEKKLSVVEKSGARRHLGIGAKLLAISMVPVAFIVLLGILSYQKASKAIVSSYETATYNTIKKTGEYYGLMLKTVEQTSLSIYNDENVIKYFSGSYKTKPTDEAKVYVDIKNSIVSQARSNEFLSGITIISEYGNSIASSGNVTNQQLSAFLESEEGVLIKNGNGKPVWLGHHTYLDGLTKNTEDMYGISVSRSIKSTTMKDVAVMTLDISPDVLTKAMESMDLPNNSYCAIVTADGREITGASMSGTYTLYDKAFYQEMMQENKTEDVAYVESDKENYLFLYAQIGETGNRVCCLIPEDQIMQQAYDIRNFTLLIVFFASVVAISLSVYMSSGIGHAIKKISKITKRAAEGDLSIAVTTKRKDEFGSLSGYVSEMLKEMKSLIGNVRTVTDTVYGSADYVANNSHELVKVSKEISDTVEGIEIGISEQAVNAENCMKKMDELTDIINHVVRSTEIINTSSTQTKEVLETGIRTMDELSENVKNTTTITKEAILDMESLNQESSQISNITKAINEIADQTNLLALNASIEAARAGAAGRGFSVVADEIRKLAEESLKASQQIQKIIGGIQIKVNGTVTTVRRAGDIVESQEHALKETVQAFASINKHMDFLNEEIDGIVMEVPNMNQARENTMDAIRSISAVLEQTAAATTEVLASISGQVVTAESLDKEAKKLEEHAKNLQNSIHIFKIS